MKIDSLEDLRQLYDAPGERALNKELNKLEKHSKHFLSLSPFAVLSTANKNGHVDASPRGGRPGFIKVLNEHQIVLADAKGNNRLDSLSNIVETGQAGLLCMIPGLDETLRINGRAFLSTDSDYLDLFSEENHPPKVCIIIQTDELYMHCAKAFMRSKLWSEAAQIQQNDFPSLGQILKDQMGGDESPEKREDMVSRYQKDL